MRTQEDDDDGDADMDDDEADDVEEGVRAFWRSLFSSTYAYCAVCNESLV